MATIDHSGTTNAEKKNSGIIRQGGTIANSKFTNQAVGESRQLSATYVQSTNSGAYRAHGSTTPKFADGSGTLAVVDVGPDSDVGLDKYPKPLETVKTQKITTALRGGNFNHVTGAWDNGYPQVASNDISEGVDGGHDTAAPSNQGRASQTKVFFQIGKRTPSSTSYRAKT